MLGAMTDLTPPAPVPAGATTAGDGILIGHGPVRVDAYIDFLCPFCRQFELAAGPALADLVAAGRGSPGQHPTNLLDGAAAAGCAADQGKSPESAHALFVSQPPEGGPGLSDEELAGLGRDAGLTGTEFAACLSAGTYRDWPSFVTARDRKS